MLVDAEIAESVIEEDSLKAVASACSHACALKGLPDSRGAMKTKLWRPPAIDSIALPSQNTNKKVHSGAHLKPGVSARRDRVLRRIHRTPLRWQQGDTATCRFNAAPRALLTGVKCAIAQSDLARQPQCRSIARAAQPYHCAVFC